METFFDWAYNSGVGFAMRDSRYAYPLLEMVHLVGMAMVLGSLLLQCSRLLGFGMRRASVAEVAEDLGPWTLSGLVLMVMSGMFMFASRATDLYDFRLQPYLTKLGLVLFGVLFYYLVQRRFARSGSGAAWTGRAIGAVTLAAFFGAALSALWVEFL